MRLGGGVADDDDCELLLISLAKQGDTVEDDDVGLRREVVKEGVNAAAVAYINQQHCRCW